VNNKFFADRNDFFKYDLLLEILEKSDLLKQLTFIPMLTPSDKRRGGHRTNYSRGLMREELFRFLQDCLVNGKRDIRELRRLNMKETRRVHDEKPHYTTLMATG